MYGWTDVRIDGWMDGWMDGVMEGGKEGRADRYLRDNSEKIECNF